MEDRQSRADRWIEGSNTRIGTVEPEWWLRMMCGQLAEDVSAAHQAGIRRLMRRAEKELRQRFRARSTTAGIAWLGELSRWDLPAELPVRRDERTSS